MPVRWESARGCHGVSLRSAPAGRSARSPSRRNCTGSVPEATIRRRAACSRPCPSGWPSGRRWTGVRCWGLGRRVGTNCSWGSRLTWGGRSRRPITVLLNARSGVSVSWRNDSLSAELSMIARFLCAAGAALALAPAVPAQQQTSAAAQPPVINEWPVPWERTRPRDPFVASDGRVWFVGQEGHYLAVFDTVSHQFTRYPLDPGTGPHNLIVDRGGVVWFSGNLVGYIGRVRPPGRAIHAPSLPPTHIPGPAPIVVERPGRPMVRPPRGERGGRATVPRGEIRRARVPTPNARPYGIVVDKSDRPWISLFGTNQIATAEPRPFGLREYALPRVGA